MARCHVAALTVFIGTHTEFGPVVVPLFEVDGVHMGDVAAGVACALVALGATAAIRLPVRNGARR